MFFENEIIDFKILDVLALKQDNIETNNTGRNFYALSFRIHADTILKSATKEYYITDNYISFVPARLNYNRTAKADELIVIHFELINCCANDIETFLPNEPEIFKSYFEEILYFWNKKDVGYKYKCASVFYEILNLCHKQHYKQKRCTSKIQNSVDFLLENYKSPNLKIKEIAEKSFVSEVYFRKLFKNEYNISPQKYIVQLRIQYASKLISTGYYTLKEIASMSGYTDYKYFSTEFKKQIGVSPSDYDYNYNK